MAVFKSFKAYRPKKGNENYIPELPYDVMSSEEAKEIAMGNPLSFLHVDKAEIDLPEGTDLYSDLVYKKASENLHYLEYSKEMIQDETPCFYIYKQIMNGRSQVGLVGCASIDDYKNNIIKKHEKTLAKKERDRINHVDKTDANTGPIFLTYRSDSIINNLVNDYMSVNEPVYDFTKDDVKQIVWVIDDAQINSQIEKEFSKIDALYIADGHHRCASAVRVGEMRRDDNPGFSGLEEFNFFLAVAFPDEDLEIMDYNRVVKDLNGYSTEEFLERISKKFDIEEKGERVKPSKQHTFGMYLDNKWYLLTAKNGIFDENNPVNRLDVSILQDNLLDPVLGILDPKNDPRIDFVGGIRGLSELERRANTDMKLAFAMYPTTVQDLMDIADANEIMPPKSTWFEPKLLSGVFVHHLS